MLWGCSGGNFSFRRRGCGALRSPIPPRVTGYERVHTLSRSPGAVRSERLVSDGTGGQRVWDSGAHTFAAGQTKLWFLTKQAGGAFETAAHVFLRLFDRRFRPPTKPCDCSGGNSGSRRRGRGALCSPTPPRGRGARGLRPSRALPGAGLAGNWFSAGAGSCSGGNFVSDGVGASVLVGVWFSTARGVGRSAPLQPLGRRVREGCDPLALSREG